MWLCFSRSSRPLVQSPRSKRLLNRPADRICYRLEASTRTSLLPMYQLSFSIIRGFSPFLYRHNHSNLIPTSQVSAFKSLLSICLSGRPFIPSPRLSRSSPLKMNMKRLRPRDGATETLIQFHPTNAPMESTHTWHTGVSGPAVQLIEAADRERYLRDLPELFHDGLISHRHRSYSMAGDVICRIWYDPGLR